MSANTTTINRKFTLHQADHMFRLHVSNYYQACTWANM